MSDEKDLNERDLKNPSDREALKKAADDFLKGRKAEAQAEVAEDIADELVDEGADAIAALETENGELRNQILRIAADMENLRRRTSKDVADAKAYSIANFARDMLQVSDNLTRALDAIPSDVRESDANLKALADGVELTDRAMLAAMERHGVKRIDPKGERFDPNFHQAMFEVPDPSQPANIVAEVVQVGYVIGDRVLRPALVGVTKGGPKEAQKVADE